MKKGTKVPAIIPDGKYHSAATVKPEEEGVYFVRNTSYEGIAYSYWDGAQWMCCEPNVRKALSSITRSTDMKICPNAQWCGAK